MNIYCLPGNVFIKFQQAPGKQLNWESSSRKDFPVVFRFNQHLNILRRTMPALIQGTAHSLVAKVPSRARALVWPPCWSARSNICGEPFCGHVLMDTFHRFQRQHVDASCPQTSKGCQSPSELSTARSNVVITIKSHLHHVGPLLKPSCCQSLPRVTRKP